MLYAPAILPANIDPTPSTNGGLNSSTVGTSAVQILAANLNRKGFSIFNASNNRTLFLGLSNSVSTSANHFIEIPPKGYFTWSMNTIFTGAIFAIANGSNATAQVLELTP
jgi:hypothetical protein